MITSFIKFVFFVCCICLIALAVITIRFGIDESPTVDRNAVLTYDNLKSVKQIIKANRPKTVSGKQIKTLSLNENELNLLLSYAISHGLDTPHLFAKAELSGHYLTFFLTAKLPRRFFGDYINFTISLRPEDNFLDLDSFRIGGITIPKVMTKPIISQLHRVLLKTELYESLWRNVQAVKKVTINGKTLIFNYTLNRGMLKELQEKSRSFLIPDEQQQRLISYHNHLSLLTHRYKNKPNAVLDLIKGIFAFAEKNSNISHNPILENTSAIQVLSLYAVGQRLDPLLKSELKKSIKSLNRNRLLFHNRTDLPKHFLVSAALTVSSGSKFANLVGLVKEIDDSDGGSGFSFADLAADKAGVKFGEMSIASPQKAILFQKKMGLLSSVNAFIPSISNLPEGIMELEFKQNYKDLNSIAYKLINAEIDKRLNQLSLYQD